MLNAIDRFLSRLSRASIVALSVTAVLITGLLDRVSGFELSFSLFYLAPTAVAAWYAGRRASTLITLLSAAAWLAADLGAGHIYSSNAIVAWNTITRLCVFLIFAELLLALRTLLASSERLARIDALTGLANRRAFDEQLQYCLALASREHRPLTLAYLDLDDFKRINDEHGHAAGDRALRVVAHTLSQAVRRSDTVARLGGDEFALLLPGTDRAGAESLIAKARQSIYAAFRSGTVTPTCSIGAVTFLEPPPDAEGMISAADALMYEVKMRGKNGVAFVQSPGGGG